MTYANSLKGFLLLLCLFGGIGMLRTYAQLPAEAGYSMKLESATIDAPDYLIVWSATSARQYNRLDWSIAEQSEYAYVNVERIAGGSTEWETLAVYPVDRTEGTMTNFYFLDPNPVSATYRLRLVHLDGTVVVSEPLEVFPDVLPYGKQFPYGEEMVRVK